MFAAKTFYKKIESYLNQMEGSRLIVPFMGTSSEVLLATKTRRFEFIWVNDPNPSIAALWRSIGVYPRKLTRKIEKYLAAEYDVAYFSAELSNLKRIPADVEEVTDIALKRLSIMKDGQVWNPVQLSRYIRSANTLLKKQSCRFTSWDFETLFNDRTENDIVYVETPTLPTADLWRLSESLHSIPNWLFITTDNEHVRKFFPWANIEETRSQLIISSDQY